MMQLTQILICVSLMIVIDAAMIPRPRHMVIQDIINRKNNNSDTSTRTMPTERHRTTLPPRKVLKLLLTPIPRQYVPTEKTTRKPLMKKLYFQNFTVNANNVFIKHTSRKPALTTRKNKKRLDILTNKVLNKQVQRPDIVNRDFQENDNNKIGFVEEETQTAVYPLNEIEEDAMNKRNLRPKRLLQLDKDSEEYLDWQKYIFLNSMKEMERERTSIEVPGAYVTTENNFTPGFSRIKRSNNIIEEENLATTVAGYKFTWHDSRLTNNLVFKNIHS